MATNGNSWENAVRWLREQPSKQQLVKDCYYDDSPLGTAERYWRSHEWQSIRLLLKEGSIGKALDVGAGQGIASYALARDGYCVTALEPNPSRLVGSEARRRLAVDTSLDIDVNEERSERLPFPNDTFDVVFGRAVLHHASDLSAACLEFARVLKPGGLFIAVREHVISRESDLQAFFDVHPLHHQYGGENAFRLGEYKNAIYGAGLVGLKVIPPWHSAINHAPNDLSGIQGSIATRFGPLAGVIRVLLQVRVVWLVLRTVLSVFDNRPGRLYSFVATAPSL
ncbi:MAG: class I SAM-dependent methyltransferase [Alphaproteobacteria bacterium]|nr:class I SAM-dependent methyltransferase [Alphaproteobacteria bacterium]